MLKLRVRYWVQAKRGGGRDVQIREIRKISTRSSRLLMRRNLAYDLLKGESFESIHHRRISYEVRSLIGQNYSKVNSLFPCELKKCGVLPPSSPLLKRELAMLLYSLRGTVNLQALRTLKYRSSKAYSDTPEQQSVVKQQLF